MKSILVAGGLALGAMFATYGGALAATAEQEAAFVAAYRAAVETSNADALTALFFVDGAIPEAVEFYTVALEDNFGKKVDSVELQDLSAEDTARVGAVMPTPSGGMARLSPKPYKKLLIKLDTSDASGTSSETTTIFVAEKDGKLGIPMPIPAN